MTTVYPMWAVVCNECGVVGTLFEKPGTGCDYVQHCFACGDRQVRTERVGNYHEHKACKEREVERNRQ